MDIIRESASHHFLTLVETIRADPRGWMGVMVRLSGQYSHTDMVADVAALPEKLKAIMTLSDECAQHFQSDPALAAVLEPATLYQFDDGDVLLVTRIKNEQEQEAVFTLHRQLTEQQNMRACDVLNFGREALLAQNVADQEMLSQQRMNAYHLMADHNRVASIPVRRGRRTTPLVLLVEDDRFTAAYANGVLQKEYDVILARTGEDAIVQYIEHAPDVVFLDIHLPGLNGQQVLEAISKVDPESYVIMVSVDAIKPNIVAATQTGAAGFLKKPFTKDRILAIAQRSPFLKGAKLPSFG